MPLLQQTIDTLSGLVSLASVSSTSNAAISEVVADHLQRLGFDVEVTSYRDAREQQKVNLVARRDPLSQASGGRAGLAYFCHTDVVPAGHWTGPGGNPFEPVVEGDRLYGRGSCDMKGSLAAMLTAASMVPASEQSAPLWIVCTADEEVGFEGAKQIVRRSSAYREIVERQPLSIIGEPTRLSVVHAHKGIVGFRVTSRGRAAHSSSTDGINANEAMVPMLVQLLELAELSRNDPRYHDERFDPPVLSWNFGVSDGCDAVNVTPEQSVAWFSLRPMPQIDGEELIGIAEQKADALGLDFQRFEGGGPFWIEPDADCISELCELAGGQPKTVCYGTDGGEFNELTQRVVCGPGEIAQAHTSDEWIELDQLQQGFDLYANAIRRWCGD